MRRDHLKLGLFALGTFALVLAAIAVFARIDLRPRDRYRMRFSRSVTGLSIGARVELWGVPIGSVRSIGFSDDPAKPVVATIEVPSSQPIPRGTRAYLQVEGLTLIKYIDLRGGHFGDNLRPGDEIATADSSITLVLDDLPGLVESGRAVLDKLEQVADELSAITDEPNRRRIVSILQRADGAIASATGAITELRRTTRRIRNRGDKLFDRLEPAGSDLLEAAANARIAMTDVRTGARELRAAAADAATITRGARGQVQRILGQLRSATSNVRLLVRSIENNPSRLLRGNDPPERGLR